MKPFDRIKELEKEIEERLNLLKEKHTIQCKLNFNEGKATKQWLKEMIKDAQHYAEMEEDCKLINLKSNLKLLKEVQKEVIEKIEEVIKLYKNPDNSKEQIKIESKDKDFWDGVNLAFQNFVKTLQELIKSLGEGK